MSGHSKWHNIQARKGKQDALKSNVFSKYAKQITIVVKQSGGDPVVNFSLRLLIDKAKAAGMPKDNIDRAIKRGTGELNDGTQMEEIMFEGFGPSGAAILVKTITDNKNRTSSDIKHIFSTFGGTVGGVGSVQWMFENCVLIIVDLGVIKNREELEMKMIEVGADDIWEEDGLVYFKTKIINFKHAMDLLKELGIEPVKAGIEWVAKDKVKVDSAGEERLKKIFEQFEDNDDVEDYYTNAE